MAAAGACKKNDVKVDTKPGPDPDTNSGPDARRAGAKPMLPNRPETDSVSWPKLVRSKWKRLDLQNPSAQNILDCELRIDTTGADLNIDIFNGLGTQIGFSPGPAPNKLKKLAVPIEEVGTYFIRVQAAQPKDESDFAILCAWEEKAPEPIAVEPSTPETPDRPRPKHHHGDKTRPATAPAAASEDEKIENGTEGRIVQAYRDGDSTVLNLDKGGSAGVHVGTEGRVLEGRSGRSPLDGGKFTVTKVIDDNRSVAKSTGSLRLGKNNRVVFFVK
jgi:hypothetical protein